MNISEEIIDSFLRGDLNSAETEAFNNALSADPELQQEVSIQKDIVEALKGHRHQQLKNRLNSIDVKPAGVFGSSYVKLAASMGMVALLVGSFALFSTDDPKESGLVQTRTTTSSESNKNQPLSVSEELSQADQPQTKVLAAATEHSGTSVNSKAVSVDAETNSVKNSSIDKTTKKSAAKLTYSEIDADEMDGGFTIQPQTDGVDMSAVNHGSATSTTSQVKVNIVKDKDLAYRFFNNQLYLHGNFSNSTYELYELNNSPSKQLFLYFAGNYYELIQGKTKVTTLTPITDKATLAQLSQLKAH